MQNPSPVDARLAEDARISRAIDRRAQSRAPIQTELPDRPVIGERLADHGSDSGREARTQLADELADLCKQVGQMRKNPTLNDAQKLLGVDEAVQSQIDRLLAKGEEQGKVIDTLQRSLDAEIDAAFTPSRTEWYGLATEYRAALLDMTDDERNDFVDRLHGTRHASLLRYSVASVPPELSGVSFGMHKGMVEATLALKDPSLLSRPGDLTKRRAALAVAIDGIKRTGAELVDKDAASMLRAFVPGSDAP